MMDEYLELLSRYLSNPLGSHALGLADALERSEREILSNPPPGQRKGLREFSPMGSLPSSVSDSDTQNVYHAPSLSEVFTTIPESDWPERIDEPEACRLRPFIWGILNQEQVGSCASEGITGAIICRRQINGAPQIKLNPWFVYGRVNGGVDRGSTLVDNLAFLQAYGVASQDVWPRSKGWRDEPNSAAYKDALRHRILDVARIRTKEEFGSALIYGLPVYFGYNGHAIFACDPIDRLRFRYANSWDVSWGDGGFGTLPYNSIYWGYGAYAILSVTTPDDEI